MCCFCSDLLWKQVSSCHLSFFSSVSLSLVLFVVLDTSPIWCYSLQVYGEYISERFLFIRRYSALRARALVFFLYGGSSSSFFFPLVPLFISVENTTIRRHRRRFFFSSLSLFIESTRIQGYSIENGKCDSPSLYCGREKKKPRSSFSLSTRADLLQERERENSRNGREWVVGELPYTFFFDHSINPANDILQANINYLTDSSSSNNDN